MPQVRVIKIVFDTELKNFEIPAFRGAVIELVGREHVAFHNHLDKGQYHYQYPVIQYKSQGKKASIVCIEDGVEQIHHFFSNNEGVIRLGNNERSLHVDSVKINKFQVQVWDQQFAYSMKSWLPLNEKNYAAFQKIEGLQDRVAFLERMLTGNILSFAKGINWTVDKPIDVKIRDISRQYWASHKGVKIQTFDLNFKTNVFLPYDIGLGKGVSMGFGTVTKTQS